MNYIQKVDEVAVSLEKQVEESNRISLLVEPLISYIASPAIPEAHEEKQPPPLKKKAPVRMLRNSDLLLSLVPQEKVDSYLAYLEKNNLYFMENGTLLYPEHSASIGRIKNNLDALDSEIERIQYYSFFEDIILFTTIAPMGRDGRSYFTPLSIEKSLGLLFRLGHPLFVSPIAFLVESGYEEGNFAQKISLLSLLKFSPETREGILNAELFIEMQKSPHLIEWIIAGSGVVEQAYLNSCCLAVEVNELLHLAPDIASLLSLSGLLLKQFAPKNRDDDENLKAIKKNLRKIENDLRALLKREQEGKELSFEQKVALKGRWSCEMQTFGALKVGLHATAKPLSNNWKLNFALMIPFIAMTPHTVERRRMPAENLTADILGKQCYLVSLNAYPDFGYRWEPRELLDRERFSVCNEATQKDLLIGLWNHINRKGYQKIVERDRLVNHLCLLKAVENRAGERVFLLSDPKVNYDKVLDFDDAILYFSKTNCGFIE